MALTVYFNGSESSPEEGEMVSYAWDFGDGAPAGSGVTTSHTYAVAGNFNVSLTVTNSCMRSDTSTQCIRAIIEKKIVTFNSLPTGATVEILS